MNAQPHVVGTPPLALPGNLDFLCAHKQFLLCVIVPKPDQPGKTNKLPVNPVTFAHPVSGKDPANWLTCDQAYAKANELNARGGPHPYGVGFWLTAELGVWCLDIDQGLDASGQWHPAVTELCNQLPGVAWEHSHSKRGIHGWGYCTQPIAAHETRHNNAERGLHLELYSRGHFMLLGTAAGAPMQPTAGLPPVLTRLFPVLSAEDAAALDADWNNEPHPTWHGPTDDAALIEIALRSRSKLATLFPNAAKATFKQLWHAEAEKLPKHFPPVGPGSDYNESQADQALACHLAFWTGNNWSRIAALMEQSALARPKHERHDYMHRTIGKACGWARDFYNDGKGITPGAAIPASAASASGITLDDFHAYLPQKSYIFVPTRELWGAAGVNASVPPLEGNFNAGDWLDRARPVHQMTWAPGLPLIVVDRFVDKGGWIERAGVNCINLYRPPAVIAGDAAQATPWLDLLRFIYPTDAEHLIRYFAHRRQRPAEKINHGVVLGGAPGVGKDTILEPLKHAVGPWNFVEVSPSNLTGEFNGFRKSVVLRVSEARDMGDVNRYALYEATKTLLATPPDVLRCNEKNLREHEVFNVMGVIFTTNHKDGLYLPRDDRRHYVAWTERETKDFREGYWVEIYRWYNTGGGLGHVVAYLDAVDLTGFDPKATPPRTPAWHAMVSAGHAPEESHLADALDVLGSPPAVTLEQVVAVVAISNPAFLGWLKDTRNVRAIPHRFEAAGYVPVLNPDAVSDGRWKVAGRRTPIYARKELTERDRIAAAGELSRAAPPPPK